MEDAAQGPVLQRRLRETFLELLPRLPQAQEQLDQVLGSDIPLGALTDIISYVLDLGLAQKQALLAEASVRRRAELLLRHLADAGVRKAISERAQPGFLPDFSTN